MEHQFLAVHYQLYSVNDGERTLEEQTTREQPFQFISGFGVSLDALEKQVLGMEKGTEFDFTLTPAEAFGEYEPEGVHKLARETFVIDGRFDAQNIYPGAIITLTDGGENQFLAHVMEIDNEGVTVDTNHPLAGKRLNFTGEVKENRKATDEEVQHLIKHLTGGCEGCGGCGHHGEGEGCGHCHH